MDLIDFAYLHPKEYVENNLNTNESLSNYYYSQSNYNLSLSNVPNTFNEYVYLNNLSNNLLLNISSLNNDIFNSMVLSGYSSNELRPTYVSIYHSDIYYLQNNTFSSLYLSTSNFNINDNIYLSENDSIFMYANITNIINDNTFQVSLNNYNQNNYYKLLGLGIYDPLRTAIISYLTNSNELTRYEYSDEFNPDLYRLLYPDTKLASKETAYISYLNNYPSRIGNADELLSQRISPKDNLDILEINNRLDLRQGSFLLFNGIKIDGVSTNSTSTSCNLAIGYEHFVTERACKTYIDSKMYTYDNINGINGINSISTSNYVHGLNSELFTIGNSLYNLNISGNNNLTDVYSENINSEHFNYIKLKLSITFDITIIDNKNIIIVLSSYYKCLYNVLNIDDEIILFNNKYKIINIDGLNIHLFVLKLSQLPSLSSPVSDIIYILSDTITKNKLYSNKYISDNRITIESPLNDYILVDKEYLFINTTPHNYIDLTSNYDFITNNYFLYEEIIPLYVVFTIYEKEWLNSKTVTLITNLTFENVYMFRYIIVSSVKYVIMNVKRKFDESSNHITLITISRFDGNNIGFDTGLGDYVILHNNNLSNNENIEGYFYIEKNNEKVLKIGTSYISSDDIYLNCDNNLLISSNNVIIRGGIYACDNDIKIIKTNDGILVDSEKIYLCSSNTYIDKLGNINTSGQIISPYFSSEIVSSQSNVITNLTKRIEELESILEKYNLFL